MYCADADPGIRAERYRRLRAELPEPGWHPETATDTARPQIPTPCPYPVPDETPGSAVSLTGRGVSRGGVLSRFPFAVFQLLLTAPAEF